MNPKNECIFILFFKLKWDIAGVLVPFFCDSMLQTTFW